MSRTLLVLVAVVVLAVGGLVTLGMGTPAPTTAPYEKTLNVAK